MIYDDVPGGFTNPFEYRDAMVKMFFHGELPEASQKASTKAKVKAANDRVAAAKEAKARTGRGQGLSGGDPALRNLQALARRSQQLRQEKAAD